MKKRINLNPKIVSKYHPLLIIILFLFTSNSYSAPPSSEYLSQFIEHNEPSNGQLFFFILEDDLAGYKQDLSDKDYDILKGERNKQKQFSQDRIETTTKILFRAIKKFIGDNEIASLSPYDYALNMPQVFEQIDNMNLKLYQKRFEKVLSKLSDPGQNWLINEAIPSKALHSSDLSIKWQNLADDNPIKFKQMHMALLTRLQTFESEEDIKVIYKETKPTYVGNGIDTDMVGSRRSSFEVVNKKR